MERSAIIVKKKQEIEISYHIKLDLLANSKEPYGRRTPFSHRSLVSKIRKLPTTNDDFLAGISDFLDESRDMREFSHYGPYIEISNNPKPSPGSIYQPLKFDFVGHIFEKELGQASQKEIEENKEKLKRVILIDRL